MKILFIGSGCACRLPFVEYLFKKKIQEAEVPDIEVESADMAMWGVTSNESGIPKSSGPDKVGNLLNQADFIVVMEGRQRNFLFEGAFRRENGNLHVNNGLNDKAYRAGTFMLGMLYD